MRLYFVVVNDFSRGLSEMFLCESKKRIREFCLCYFREISKENSPDVEWEGFGMAQAYINEGLDVFVYQVNYDNSKSYFDAWDEFPSPGYLVYKKKTQGERNDKEI